MRSLRVVVLDPSPDDVVKLISTEANEVIQTFSLERADKRFHEGIRLGGTGWTLEASNSRGLPELIQ